MRKLKECSQMGNKKIVIYGAGRYGKTLYGLLEKTGMNVVVFVRSKGGSKFMEWYRDY